MSNTSEWLISLGKDPERMFDWRFHPETGTVAHADAETLERMNRAAKLLIDNDLGTSETILDMTDPLELAEFLEGEARHHGLMEATK
jgi:hypothetical protein